MPPESHFIPRLAPRNRDTPFDLERILEHPQIRSWDVDADKVRATAAEQHATSFAEAVDALFTTYARQEGKPRWGDKTPGYVEHLPQLASLFPTATFVHVIRDGREVATSLAELPWGPASPIAGAFWWRRKVRSGRRSGARLGRHRYHELRLEDLVRDPEGELRRLCAFIGEEFDPAMLDYPQSADEWMRRPQETYMAFTHPHLTKPPTAGLRDWRRGPQRSATRKRSRRRAHRCSASSDTRRRLPAEAHSYACIASGIRARCERCVVISVAGCDRARTRSDVRVLVASLRGSSGIATYTLSLVEGMAALGHDVVLLDETANVQSEAGVTVVPLTLRPRGVSRVAPFTGWTDRATVEQVAGQHDVDVVHATQLDLTPRHDHVVITAWDPLVGSIDRARAAFHRKEHPLREAGYAIIDSVAARRAAAVVAVTGAVERAASAYQRAVTWIPAFLPDRMVTPAPRALTRRRHGGQRRRRPSQRSGAGHRRGQRGAP